MKLNIFFKTAPITSKAGDAAHSVDVAEWKPAGSLLAAVDKGGDSRCELVGDGYVEDSADRTGIISLKPGYPRIERTERDGYERVTIGLEPLFSVSDDGWTVRMTMYPPIEGCPQPSFEAVMSMLSDEGITWGIREKKIQSIIERVAVEQEPVAGEIIARGRLPVNGADGRLRMNFASQVIAGKEDSSGTIDFHERNIFIGVEQGQLLATKVAATEGLPGINIFGHEVPQVRGKELAFNAGPDIVCDETTGEIRAAIAGVVSAVHDTSVRITDKLNISSDVDYSTGNIDCRGGLEIGGTVRPDFKVKAGGDLVIAGNIESAVITCGANVIVRGGEIGRKSHVEAAGAVSLLYIESGTVCCGGTLTVEKEAYFCELNSGKDVLFKEGSVVVGSNVISGGDITVADVDTNSSPVSFLAAAVDYKRYGRYLELEEEVRELREKARRMQHRLGSGGRSDDLEDVQEDLQDAEEQLNSFNLIPGSPVDDMIGGLRYACSRKIIVKGTILGGVTIRIGNTETRIDRIISKGYFNLIAETGEIVFVDNRLTGKNG